MKKRLFLLVLAVICMMTLPGCGCKHETWLDAGCVTPKTCETCGETEGAPLGHSWLAATCDTAKACETCGETEGEPAGHSWADATCDAPKTCEGCGLTEGEALGHSWLEATTELPRTCETCGMTEGERIITDPRFTTADTARLQGSWICDIPMPPELLDLPGMEEDITCRFTLNLENDGALSLDIGVTNQGLFVKAMTDHMAGQLYDQFAESGMNREEADAAMEISYDMNVPEYAAKMVEDMDIGKLFEQYHLDGVYYADADLLYIGQTWEEGLGPAGYILEGDTLTIDADITGFGFETTVFTRSNG